MIHGITTYSASGSPQSLRGRVFSMGWGGWLLVALVSMLAGVGVAMLYSVSGASWDPYASRHATRFAFALLIMLTLGFLPLSAWSSVAYPSYFVALALLVLVELRGTTAMGATRWIDFGPIRVQPSEIMKLALVLALARYYHGMTLERVSSFLRSFRP